MASHRPARSRLLLCTLLALLVLTGASFAGAGPGSAAPAPVRAGIGYRLPGGDFVGFYLTRSGVPVYCIDPGKRAPGSVALGTVARYPGMSARTAAELAYALTTWGPARSRVQAAAESELVNTIVGHADAVARRARSLPGSVRTLVAAHLRTVHALRGPYRLTVRAPRVAAPGQTATGSVGLRAASGRGVPGAQVRLRGGPDVTVPPVVRTDARGSAAFRYTVTGPGPVRIDAVAGGLPATSFTGTHPAAGQQRMVTWAPTVVASAAAGFEAGLGALSHSYACTTTCNGRPQVTLHACAAASAYQARLTVWVGAVAHPVDFPAAGAARCRSTVLVLADGDRVSATWSFRGPHGWTPPVAAGGGFVVDCPAVPAVQLALTFDCTRGSVTATVVAPPTHPAVLVIGGAATRRVEVAAGGVARFAAALSCGTVQSYTVQAGVQRLVGGWNYGPAARVATPGPARQP